MIQILWNCKKKFFGAVVMQNIEKVFILFLRIIYTDFKSSHVEPSTLERLHWMSFLIKIACFRTPFLHYISRYISVPVKQKNSKNCFKILSYLAYVSKTSESFGIPDASL